MKKLFTGLLVLLFFVVGFEKSYAQDDAPKPKYLVWEVKVTPVQLGKSLDAIKMQHEFLKEQNYPYQGFVQYTNDGFLWYSTTINNLADIDKMDAVDEEMWKANEEKAKEMQDNFKDAYQSVGSVILELQPELSIIAPESDSPRTGQKFRFFQHFYVKNGKGKEFSELVKQYVALRKKHGITDGFYTLYPKLGPNMSIVYFIDEMGNSAAEHYAQSDKAWEMFGEEGKNLREAVMLLIDKVESHTGWANYDASYMPEN